MQIKDKKFLQDAALSKDNTTYHANLGEMSFTSKLLRGYQDYTYSMLAASLTSIRTMEFYAHPLPPNPITVNKTPIKSRTGSITHNITMSSQQVDNITHQHGPKTTSPSHNRKTTKTTQSHHTRGSPQVKVDDIKYLYLCSSYQGLETTRH